MIHVAAGVGLYALGYLLRLWSEKCLNEVGVLDVEEIVAPRMYTTRGPYRYIRHPIYLSAIMMFGGVGVAFLGWGGIILGLPTLPFFRERVLRENKLCEEVRNASS